MDLAGTGDRATDHAAARRPVQFHHERLIEAWAGLARGRSFISPARRQPEDARHAGLPREPRCRRASHQADRLADIGGTATASFVDLDDRAIELAIKLYPWEWMLREEFGARLTDTPTRWIEPPWKTILSNKGILPLLWEMFPHHPNLLPAYFEDDPRPHRSAPRSSANRCIPAKGPMSGWSAAA